MPTLPQPECPTILNAKAVAEFTQQEERRDYIGASLIGHPCSRHIWYRYHGYPSDSFDAETLWRFEDGHRIEEIVINRLRQVPGVQIWDKQPDGSQYSFRALGGKFGGHLDGVILGLPVGELYVVHKIALLPEGSGSSGRVTAADDEEAPPHVGLSCSAWIKLAGEVGLGIQVETQLAVELC